jgi:hypothetical protein
VIEIPRSRYVSDPRNITQATGVFRRVVRDGRYDIVNLHTPIAASVARASIATLRRRDRPLVIYTAHGFYFGAGGAWHHELPFLIVERVLGRYTDRLIVINDIDRANAERRRIDPRDCIVLHPGIGIDFAWYARTKSFLAAVSGVRTALGIDAAAPMFTIDAGMLQLAQATTVIPPVVLGGTPAVRRRARIVRVALRRPCLERGNAASRSATRSAKCWAGVGGKTGILHEMDLVWPAWSHALRNPISGRATRWKPRPCS